MKKILFAVFVLFIGCSVSASTHCPTPEEYTNYLRNYANKAKNMALKGGSQAQFEATRKSFENYKPKTSHACLNYFTNVQTPDCRRLKVLYSAYDSIKEEAERKHIEDQIISRMGMFEEKCPVDTQAMKFFMQRSKEKRNNQGLGKI